MAKAMCGLATADDVIDRVEVAMTGGVPSDFEVVMTYRRGDSRAQVHMTATRGAPGDANICDGSGFFTTCNRYAGATPSSLGHDKYGNVWMASYHADGTLVKARSSINFSDAPGDSFDGLKLIGSNVTPVHGVVLASDGALLSLVANSAFDTTRPVADDGVADRGDCTNPATFVAGPGDADPQPAQTERVRRASCTGLPPEWTNVYLESDGSIAYAVDGKWGEIGVSFSDVADFDNPCAKATLCRTTRIGGVRVSTIRDAQLGAPLTVAVDGATAITLAPNTFPEGGSVAYDITELQDLAVRLLAAYEGH
jgi:hypothetical protein